MELDVLSIAAHRDGIKRSARILCITTGGETERLAVRHRQPIIRIPSGVSARRRVVSGVTRR